MSTIKTIQAYEVLDSRGNPTVAAVVTTQKGQARAMVPSGASTGAHEAVELRDGDAKRYGGKGVLKACENVNTVLRDALVGKEVDDQAGIDKLMIDLDGSVNKGTLGANAILGVSLACARAAAQENGKPLYEYLRELRMGEQGDRGQGNAAPFHFAVPMMNVLNGGKHADSGLDIQEFMIVPAGARTFAQALQMGAEVFHALGDLLQADGQVTTVGDEGGYAPKLPKQEDAMEYILRAIEKAGYAAGKDVFIALDPAASEFYTANGGERNEDGNGSSGIYSFRVNGKRESLNSDDMIAFWKGWKEKYPIVSIEDGLAEDDWGAWSKMTAEMGGESGGGGLQIVGDDLLVTNTERLQKGIQTKAANSILIKLNQIGSLTEAAAAITMAKKAGWTSVVSHRSGETEDTFIADLAVGCETGQIKTGSLSRSERVAKYNRLLEIERELGDKAVYPGVGAFKK